MYNQLKKQRNWRLDIRLVFIHLLMMFQNQNAIVIYISPTPSLLEITSVELFIEINLISLELFIEIYLISLELFIEINLSFTRTYSHSMFSDAQLYFCFSSKIVFPCNALVAKQRF